IPFDAGLPLDISRHIGLAHEPGDETLCDCMVIMELSCMVGAEHRSVLRLHRADLGQPGLHEIADAAPERIEVVRISEPARDFLLEPQDPLRDHGPERTRIPLGSAQAFHCTAVYRFQTVQRRVVLGYLDLGYRETPHHGLLLVPTRGEALAA